MSECEKPSKFEYFVLGLTSSPQWKEFDEYDADSKDPINIFNSDDCREERGEAKSVSPQPKTDSWEQPSVIATEDFKTSSDDSTSTHTEAATSTHGTEGASKSTLSNSNVEVEQGNHNSEEHDPDPNSNCNYD